MVGKGQQLQAALVPVEEAVLDPKSTGWMAAASLRRWELSDVGGEESLHVLIKCYV